MISYTCPVCAYSQMPYGVEEGNICPCCGTEFGFDDVDGRTFRDIRDQWVAAGTPWFSTVREPGLFWNGVSQLVQAGFDYTAPAMNMRVATTPAEVTVPGRRDAAWTLADLAA